jgi:hypothetical protein
VTDGKTVLLGQIELPVTLSGRDNFRTENFTFDVAHFDLPYNTILGHPALAKFMAAVHYAYNTLKLAGPAGVISIKADVKRLGPLRRAAVRGGGNHVHRQHGMPQGVCTLINKIEPISR